jgi:ribonuclease P protein component
MREDFPKTGRLRKRAEYLAVQQRGRKVQSDHFFLLQVLPPSDRTRIGVTISSKVGKAVVRNRLRRWIREYLRRHKSDLPPGDLVMIGKTTAATATHPLIDADLARLFAKARARR